MFCNFHGNITGESSDIISLIFPKVSPNMPPFYFCLKQFLQVLIQAIQWLLSCVTEDLEEQDNQQQGNLSWGYWTSVLFLFV